MRATFLALVFLAGCGPSEFELEIDRTARENCAGFDECLLFTTNSPEEADGCDFQCASVRQCCQCLAELDCNMPSESQCVSNLDRGGTIAARAECSSNEGLCGGVCSTRE
jgi:hypothetical protein